MPMNNRPTGTSAVHRSADRAARSRAAALLALALAAVLGACAGGTPVSPADLLIVNARVYTLSWDEPGEGGAPASNAPHGASGWKPDAEAIAIAGGRIALVGAARDLERYRGERTRVIDAQGATVLPGLVDSHTHIFELGTSLERVNLRGVPTEAEAVERVAAWAASVPKGQWIIGRGWDEGAWANHYPDMTRLSEKVPDHPVVLIGLHSFAVWGNRLAFEKAGITAATISPVGGDIRRGPDGRPSGILLNRATALLESAIPPPTDEQVRSRMLAGLNAMAASGYVSVHEAGADSGHMKALEALEADGRLPLRVYAMLSGRDGALLAAWRAKGPDTDTESMLRTRSVKAFYDGALGSRGARLLDDYSDRKGHRGLSGSNYGFDRKAMTDMINAGFQVAIHAIGDAGNRETLDFLQSVAAANPASRELRHRIEHAQVLRPADIPRFADLGVTASMEPPHAVEDKAWAEDRLGPERVKGAYAWRSLRRAGARLVFNSDLPGSDHNIFYGLHSAITRRDTNRQPDGGWYPEQRMTPEEAVRGYTTWAAYTAFIEKETGVIATGRWADLTIISIDPFVLGESDPGQILDGRIRATIVGGKVVYDLPL